MKLCCIVVLVLSAAIPAEAQDSIAEAPKPTLIISQRAIAAALAEHPPAQPTRRRDSARNGALIGGLVVGGALAGTGTYLCNALKEEGDPSCWKGVLTMGAIGFAAGALVGAGIDLLFTRSTPTQSFGKQRPVHSFLAGPLAPELQHSVRE